jgi:hypothetical protein
MRKITYIRRLYKLLINMDSGCTCKCRLGMTFEKQLALDATTVKIFLLLIEQDDETRNNQWRPFFTHSIPRVTSVLPLAQRGRLPLLSNSTGSRNC